MSIPIPVMAPVPPMLEQALGYDHEIASRWVGFHWTPAGDELMYDDGRRSAGGEWHAWLLYTRHARVWPHLAGHHFGNSDEPAREWLLLDRRARRLYVAPAAQARANLRDQWDWTTPIDSEAAPFDWVAVQSVMEGLLEREHRRPQAAIMAEVQRRMAAQHRLESELAAWLDAWRPGEGEKG